MLTPAKRSGIFRSENGVAVTIYSAQRANRDEEDILLDGGILVKLASVGFIGCVLVEKYYSITEIIRWDCH